MISVGDTKPLSRDTLTILEAERWYSAEESTGDDGKDWKPIRMDVEGNRNEHLQTEMHVR